MIEVYPAAALAEWDLPSRGYKGTTKRAEREEILGGILAQCGTNPLLHQAISAHEDTLTNATWICRSLKYDRDAGECVCCQRETTW